MNQGLFVSFEGIDGSGKSTQMQRCAQWLSEKGHDVVLTRNPGGTDLGLEIRQLLLHHPGFVSPTAELMLYMADRAQHLDAVVLPALAAGKVVLCDRYGDSSVAYQGYGRGLDIAQINQLNTVATQGVQPQVTFLYTGPVETLLTRVQRRGQQDRLEQESVAFFERVQNGYQTIAAQNLQRFCCLDATLTEEALFAQLCQYLEPLLKVLSQ